MGMEDLITRIKEESRSEIDDILNDARSKVSSMKETEETRVKDEIKELEKKLLKELENIKNVHLSDGKRKARQALLSAKEDLIWETISLVRKRFSEMDEEELASYLIPMYEKTSEALGDGISVYPVRDIDLKVLSGKPGVKGKISEIKVLLGPVSRSNETDLLGGFIGVGSDGKKVVNMTFSGILDKEEERIRETIARTLFGE